MQVNNTLKLKNYLLRKYESLDLDDNVADVLTKQFFIHFSAGTLLCIFKLLYHGVGKTR